MSRGVSDCFLVVLVVRVLKFCEVQPVLPGALHCHRCLRKPRASCELKIVIRGWADALSRKSC